MSGIGIKVKYNDGILRKETRKDLFVERASGDLGATNGAFTWKFLRALMDTFFTLRHFKGTISASRVCDESSPGVSSDCCVVGGVMD